MPKKKLVRFIRTAFYFWTATAAVGALSSIVLTILLNVANLCWWVDAGSLTTSTVLAAVGILASAIVMAALNVLFMAIVKRH